MTDIIPTIHSAAQKPPFYDFFFNGPLLTVDASNSVAIVLFDDADHGVLLTHFELWCRH